MLLADELSLGLAPIIVTNLLKAVRAAADERGIGVLLVEQHVRQALKIADRVYLMERGRIVLSGTSNEVLQPDRPDRGRLPRRRSVKSLRGGFLAIRAAGNCMRHRPRPSRRLPQPIQECRRSIDRGRRCS